MNNPSFTAKYLTDVSLTEEAQRYLKVIDQNFDDDFSTQGRGYFSAEDRELIQQRACAQAKELFAKATAPIDGEKLRQVWAEIVTDFHRNSFWGFQPLKHKPVQPLTEEQKTYRELWPYIWVLIQSGIILKTVVYFFGIRASNDPSPENTVYLILALLTSLGTLVFFAWRKHRK
ncbi:hypothetical protein [Bdellovibrio sp. NC01]|uniref:hypothetical protein n=1 Tax=Bdellovibrio sp. NC01 TaxID=2220073 RepID=UPI0011587CD9|nr:hypothetical protein [Bdellovibrio sp. NC01]QDK39486.1 hypothetical protein DOE51_18725 [Bdellovibrio sp. NC01]